MTLLFDSAHIDFAHEAGMDDAHHINSPDRLTVWDEHGGVTITRGVGKGAPQIELTAEELTAVFRNLVFKRPDLRLVRAPSERAA